MCCLKEIVHPKIIIQTFFCGMQKKIFWRMLATWLPLKNIKGSQWKLTIWSQIKDGQFWNNTWGWINDIFELTSSFKSSKLLTEEYSATSDLSALVYKWSISFQNICQVTDPPWGFRSVCVERDGERERERERERDRDRECLAASQSRALLLKRISIRGAAALSWW